MLIKKHYWFNRKLKQRQVCYAFKRSTRISNFFWNFYDESRYQLLTYEMLKLLSVKTSYPAPKQRRILITRERRNRSAWKHAKTCKILMRINYTYQQYFHILNREKVLRCRVPRKLTKLSWKARKNWSLPQQLFSSVWLISNFNWVNSFYNTTINSKEQLFKI